MGSPLYLSISMSLVTFVSLFFLVSSAQPLCHPDERSALLQFKESFVLNSSASSRPDAYPKTESWKVERESGDCCSWQGVQCDNSTGHVIGLDLTSCYLYGSINSGSSLFRLVHLQRLNLADNVFKNSEIPSEIRNLSRLTSLDLSYSNFSGQIPSEILQLSELELLDLSGNPLTLQKPGLRSLLEKLTNLKELYLTDVRISSSVPANFPSLTALILSNCHLRGEFPTGIFELPTLQFLSLQSNPNLTGYLPDIQINHPLLKLSLANTSFSGQLPKSIGNFKSLEYLDISNCHFSGKVPYSLGNLSELTYLDMSLNSFSGPIPTSVGNLNQLVSLDFSYNNFSGKIPSSLDNLTQLVYLSLSTNNFDNGTLSWIGTQTNLEFLDLTSTNLSGNIPSSLKNLTQITFLHLRANKLDGQIPPWIGNLTKLTEIKFQENVLGGPIPESIFKLENLELLDLQSNRLNGILKLDSFLELKNLTRLLLSGNNLSLLTDVSINASPPKFQLLGLASCNLSVFPDFLRSQDKLEFLDLSQNQLQGRIPRSLAHCSHLEVLDLGNNLINDTFPSWLGSLPKLKILILRANKLHGVMGKPQGKSEFSRLQVIDLSGNSLRGKLPSEYFNIWNAMEVANTNGLSPYMNANTSFQDTEFSWSDYYKYAVTLANRGRDLEYVSVPNSISAIDLSSNKFQGEIPETIVNLKLIHMLNLSSNNLRGHIPASLGELTNLEYLDLSRNKLSGKIPPMVCSLSFLMVLDLSNNNLIGMLPQSLDSLSESLKVLNLRNNHFTGAIPSSSTSFESCGLRVMDLSQNQLQGGIPTSLAHCSQLEVLNLGNNLINDTFPSWLGSLPKLKVLILRANKLHGVIGKPQAKPEFFRLQVIDLSHNSLRGKLPSEYFNVWNAMEVANTNGSSRFMNAYTNGYNYAVTLTNKGRDLEYELNVPEFISGIDLSSNKFQGEIPEAIANLKLIRMLNLSNNNLSGHIPAPSGELTNLESLDLSRNKLSGKIPQQLVNLNFLAIFNVSYNNLEGPIPRGAQFNTFNNDSYEGNSRLYGCPLTEKCGNPQILQPPPPLDPEEDEGIESAFKFGWKIVLAGYGAGLIIGISLGYDFAPRKHEWFMKVYRKWQGSNNWNGCNWY